MLSPDDRLARDPAPLGLVSLGVRMDSGWLILLSLSKYRGVTILGRTAMQNFEQHTPSGRSAAGWLQGFLTALAATIIGGFVVFSYQEDVRAFLRNPSSSKAVPLVSDAPLAAERGTQRSGSPTSTSAPPVDARHSASKPASPIRGTLSAADREMIRDRFVVNSDGTVLDRRLDIVWQAAETQPMDWYRARRYANELVLAGHSDWRLPTSRELSSLSFPSNGPLIRQAVFPAPRISPYWTGESCPIINRVQRCGVDLNADVALATSFGQGSSGTYYKTAALNVRVVRRTR